VRTVKPLIGIPADRRLLGHHYFHCVGEKYIAAVADGAQAMPVVIPSTGSQQLETILESLDGLLFPGSPSNVEPHRYAGPPSDAGTLHDPHRDATTLPLISRAVASGMPVLAICRGFQEMNVAFGGTLWQKLHEVEGHRDHRENGEATLDEQYGPIHDVELTSGGLFEKLAGSNHLKVNSLHGQGVQRLGRDLAIEARAPDGVVEAFRVANAPGFAVAVQWHPEWKFKDNPFSRALFAAFGTAAAQYAARRP
jgi:putative glutamine amidotransferase